MRSYRVLTLPYRYPVDEALGECVTGGRGRGLWKGRCLESLPLLLLLGGVYSGGAGLVGQGEAQGEPTGCRGDGEGVCAHEWDIARPLVVGLEGKQATQFILGT